MFTIRPYYRNSVFSDFDRFFDDFARPADFRPVRADISENDGAYIIKASLPGFEKDDISVEVKDDVLTISASRKAEEEEKSDNGYYRKEIYDGSYKRSFDVSEVNQDGITAEYKNGILSLTLPKKEAAEPEVKKILIA